MAEIEARTRTVYYAPTKGRHYLTLAAACWREAAAMIERKYPTEPQNAEDFYNGWHWTDDARLVLVRERLARRIYWKARRSADNG